MTRSIDQIQTDFIGMLAQLADDWDYDGTITKDTLLLADLGFESLDVVVLGTAVQEYYAQTMPFADFFGEIGQRDVRDVSVGEWVDFIAKHLNGVTS